MGRGRRGRDIKPLSQSVGIPHGQLLSRLDVSQCPVENLRRNERLRPSAAQRGKPCHLQTRAVPLSASPVHREQARRPVPVPPADLPPLPESALARVGQPGLARSILRPRLRLRPPAPLSPSSPGKQGKTANCKIRGLATGLRCLAGRAFENRHSNHWTGSNDLSGC